MYRILCDRTPARELGSGLTWFKEDGKIVEFSTPEEAEVQVKKLSEGRRAATTKYTTKNLTSIKINSSKYPLAKAAA